MELIIDHDIYAKDYSYEQAIKHEPGTLFQAQEGTICMICYDHTRKGERVSTINQSNIMVHLGHPRNETFPTVYNEASGYVQFRLLKPCRLSLIVMKKEDGDS
jgi:hypothetical protein